MMTEDLPARWRITLGKIPAIMMLVSVLLTAALLHFSWQHAFHRSVFDLAQKISNRITSEIAYETGLLLGSASAQVTLVHKLLTQEVVALEDKRGQEVLFLSVLQSNPNFSWVTLGFPSGDFFGTQRQTTDRFRSVKRHWKPDVRLAESTDRFFNREGETLTFSHTAVSEVRYFAPERAWYREAVRAGRRVWTDVYIYASSQKPGIDVAMPLEKGGQVVGAVAVGIELDQISGYLSKLEVGKSGISFIVNTRGELIAYRDTSEVVVTDQVGEKFRLGQLSQARAPLLRVAAQAMAGGDSTGVRTMRTHTVEVEGVEYLVTTAPSIHGDWLIGTVIPLQEFVSEVDLIQNRLLLLVGMVVLLLSTLILLWIRAFLVRPLIATTDLITRIGQGEAVQEEAAQSSPIVEICRLTQAMRRMGEDLVTLRNQEREEAEKRLERERNFAKLSRKMREAENIDDLCRVGLVFLIRVLDAQIGAVYLLEGKRRLQLRAHHALSPGRLPEWLEVRDEWLEWAMQKKEMQILSAIPEKSFVLHAGIWEILPDTIITLPLLQNEQPYGVLIIGSIQPVADVQLKFAQRVASAMTGAIGGILAMMRNRALLQQTMEQKEALTLSQNELNATIEQLQKTSEYKSQFLANMSHEIRTPINAVIGMSYLALRTQLTDTQYDYLNKIHSSAHALLGIINDILDFSKIEAGELQMESVAFTLDEVLETLAGLVCLKAEGKGLHVLFSRGQEVPNRVVGDPLRLGQILTNLANNAVKFTEKGDIVVRIERLQEEKGRVALRFAVEDSGIGLTEVQREKLFNPFSQADASTTRKYGGTGLGLSICKHLVEKMGGAIGVESQLGRGSVFHFTAWLDLPAPSEAESPQPVEADLPGMRVLVVDDQPRSRQVLQTMLEGFSWQCHGVTSGEAALEAMERVLVAPQADPYPLVILRWKMAGMDGLEVARQLRAFPYPEQPPHIILVTPYNREEVIPKADRYLCHGFFPQPVTSTQLMIAVLTALGKLKPEGRKNRKQDPTQNTEAARHILGARVLLADDNTINQQVSTALLEGHGLKVTVVGNGRAALMAAQKETFDIILMDIQMPEMDGFQATQAIRQLPAGRGVPIIALTAHAMAGDREKSLQAGMDDHLTKPIEPDTLFKTLVRWIPPRERGAEEPSEQSVGPVAVADSAEQWPGIDREVGLRQVAGNRRLLKKLLGEFYQDYHDVVVMVRTALDQGRREDALRLIHTVKGISGSLGAQELQRTARDLEGALKTEQSGWQEVLLDQFAQAAARLMQGLGTLPPPVEVPVPAVVQEASAVPSVEGLQPLFQELAQRLYAGHSRSAEKLEEIQGRLGQTAQAACSDIRAKIEEYEFDEALKALTALARLLEIPLEVYR